MIKTLPLTRTLAASMIAIAALGLPARADPDHGTAPAQNPSQPHEQWLQQRLEHEAALLEIRASQQAAWNRYKAAAEAVSALWIRPAANLEQADAATLIRAQATALTQTAEKLGQLADAAEQLTRQLDPNQREVLNRIVRTHALTAARDPGGAPHAMHRGNRNMERP